MPSRPLAATVAVTGLVLLSGCADPFGAGDPATTATPAALPTLTATARPTVTQTVVPTVTRTVTAAPVTPGPLASAVVPGADGGAQNPTGQATTQQGTDQQGSNQQVATGPARVLLLLDDSGSMAEPAGSGETKMQAARTALTRIIDETADDAQVGLRVYGSTIKVKGPPTAAACRDSRLVHPVGPLDRPTLKRLVNSFTPHGDTPIGYALRQAADDLGSGGRRTVILVSDGKESCYEDPCDAVKALEDRGIGVTIHTVGLAVDSAARSQLQCIASASNGTYQDASTSWELTRTLQSVLAAARAGSNPSGTSGATGTTGTTGSTGTTDSTVTTGGTRTADVSSTAASGRPTAGALVTAVLLIILFFWLKPSGRD
ncbi:VWA domain-containing protein [Arsenicicoccus piscis]|uniref:VWFA domain-containing protein n=1 Tax=Arsenicicoccus piscis TaxID=673954 RepID=A0ABQ6HQT7_9MICO|nr:VWA domain-containing protein [Arsenicicoccus piscis]MCH8629076.1 VWA domain-containing protein [Arsenicicoccus piscis]GMA20372.1 hypothetical protein GCM10025862_23930 [Arsenicicoccus piscis]